METTVADLLAAAARAEPSKIALSEAATGRTVTWAALDDLADRVAHGLNSAGMIAGYRVMIAATNRIEFVATYLGVLRARMVAVPINPRSATGEVVRMLVDSGSRMVVADGSTIGTVRGAVAGVTEALASSEGDGVRPRIVSVGTTLEPGERSWDHLVMETGTPLPGEPDPEALAVLLYTSGTSGRPRAAMLSHRALVANLEQAAAVDPPMLTSDDVVYGVLPLFHVYGLNAVLGQVLHQQASLVVADGFDPDGSLDDIAEHGVTVVPVAPPVLAAWRSVDRLRERLAGVRVLMSGSAPLSPELVTETTEATGLTVHQGYGLTEAAPVVTSTLCSEMAKPGSVGSPLPGVRLRLVDDTGAEPEGGDP